MTGRRPTNVGALAQHTRRTGQPFLLFHTHVLTEEKIREAGGARTSVDMDICVDDAGAPYIGHSSEFYEKSGEQRGDTVSYQRALELVAELPVIALVDLKRHDALDVVDLAVERLGPDRCVLHAFVEELRFEPTPGEIDYRSEWTPAARVHELKARHPGLTTCAGSKWAPVDAFTSNQHRDTADHILDVLTRYQFDAVRFHDPEHHVGGSASAHLDSAGILPWVRYDFMAAANLPPLYLGETDDPKMASLAYLP